MRTKQHAVFQFRQVDRGVEAVGSSEHPAVSWFMSKGHSAEEARALWNRYLQKHPEASARSFAEMVDKSLRPKDELTAARGPVYGRTAGVSASVVRK